jgi:hypothetical protein
VYYFELHESDDDLFTDALLAHEQEFSEGEFFDLVMEARGRVLESFEEDTLVEAIAHELERASGFVYIDDGRLIAAVNVSRVDDDNAIAAVETEADEEEADEDDDHGIDEGDAGFRSLIVRLDRDERN